MVVCARWREFICHVTVYNINPVDMLSLATRQLFVSHAQIYAFGIYIYIYIIDLLFSSSSGSAAAVTL